MKDYNRNNTLYSRLLAAARHDKLPILDNKTFESMNAEYGKEEMRRNLADYIATERPVFPLKEISEDTMRECFYNLQKFDTNSICVPKEQVDKEVFEKYDDYEYSYSKYGLGLINGPSTYNDVSNYFMQDLRLECSSYGFRAPKEVWENGDAYDIWKCLGPIWRGINGMKPVMVDGREELRGGKLDDKIKSGEIKESELLEEASDMIKKMKSMPGMGNMQELFKKGRASYIFRGFPSAIDQFVVSNGLISKKKMRIL